MPSHRVKAHDLEVADPDWHADLAEWTAQRDKPFTLAEAMCSGLGFQDPLLITRDEQRRAAACLRILGYHRRHGERRENCAAASADGSEAQQAVTDTRLLVRRLEVGISTPFPRCSDHQFYTFLGMSVGKEEFAGRCQLAGFGDTNWRVRKLFPPQ